MTASGGELNAAITRAVVGIHTRYLGRGPESASTFFHGNVVVTLMFETLTAVERSLARGDRHDVIRDVRRALGRAIDRDCRDAVQRLTGRTVVALVGGSDLSANVAAVIFVLDAAP